MWLVEDFGHVEDYWKSHRQVHRPNFLSKSGPDTPHGGDIPLQVLRTALELSQTEAHVVVDYGTGMGRVVTHLATFFPGTCVALDYHDSGRTAQLTAEQMVPTPDLDRLRFGSTKEYEQSPEGGWADCIFVVNVLHEIPLVELPERLYHIARWLRPGGVLLLSDLAGCLDRYEPSFVVWEEEDYSAVFSPPHFKLLHRQGPNPSHAGDVHWMAHVFAKDTTSGEPSLEHFKTVCEAAMRAKERRLASRVSAKQASIKAKMLELSRASSVSAPAGEIGFNQQMEVETSKLQEDFAELQVQHRHVSWQLADYLRSRYQEKRVGSHGVHICFRRVRPGKEFTTIEQLADRDGSRTAARAKTARHFWTFGEFDLLSIKEFGSTDEFAAAVCAPETIPDVTATNSVFAFQWEEFSVAVNDLSGPIIGVSFVKIDDDALAELGLVAEYRLLDHLRSSLSAALNDSCPGSIHTLSILGSLGWYELVVLISSDSLAPIQAVTNKLREIRADSIGLSPSDRPLVRYSFTVLAVDLNARALVDRELQNTYVEIGVTANPGASKLVEWEVQSRFTNGCGLQPPRSGLGKAEFVVGGTPRGGLLSELISFREQLAEHLFSTHTAVSFAPLLLHLDSTSRPEPFLERDRQVEGAKYLDFDWDILEGFEHSYRTLRNVRSQYAACVTDQTVENEIRDVGAALRLIATDLRRFRGIPDDERARLVRETVSPTLRTLLTALEQRYRGTYATVFSINEINFAGISGGIQRIIKAANWLPAALLQQFHHEWDTVAVFGVSSAPFRASHGVIHYVFDDIIQPSNWTWTIHESGHEFLAQHEQMEDIAQNYKEVPGGIDQLWDIFADVFLLKCSYKGDFQRFLKEHWKTRFKERFVDRKERERHLYRLFGMFAFSNVLYLRGDSDEDIRQAYKDFAELLSRYGYRPVDLLELADEAVVFKALRNTLAWVRTMMVNLRIAFGRRNWGVLWNEAQRHRDMEALQEGQCLSHIVRNPEELICELASLAAPTLRTELAALLSLWGSYLLVMGSRQQP